MPTPDIIVKESWDNDFYEVLPIVASQLNVDSQVAAIKGVFRRLIEKALSDREAEIVAGIEGKLCSDCKDKLENHAL